MERELIIESTALTKAYGTHVALDSLDVKIEKGSTGLLGPNGAGKSTFLKTILGLIQLTSGEGKVLGFDIRTQGDQIRQRIGYMPEYDALNPGMDAIHQVRYSGEIDWNESKHCLAKSAPGARICWIREQRYRQVSTFSTGMKQATKLACALIHDPAMIIADEPSNGLDAKAREFMLNTLENHSKRRAKIGSNGFNNLMDDVERACENIVLLHKGKLAAQGKIEDLKAIDKEVEIHVWGSPGKMEETLKG